MAEPAGATAALTGRLLRWVSWAEWRHHALRQATAVLAVLLGVALAFSVHLINASALSEFGAAVRSVHGEADLRLSAAHGQLDESLYPRVARHPQVALVSPVIELQTQALDRQGRRQALKLVAQDSLVAAPLAPALLPQLATGLPGLDRLALFAPSSVLLNAVAQRRLGVAPGEQVQVQAGARDVSLRVVGSVGAGGEPLAVMDLAGAQEHFGLLGRLSRLDVKLVEGAVPAEVVRSLALPPGVLAEQAEEASQRLSNMSRAYRVNLTVLALVALFTGAFLVFSIQSLTVAKRLPQLALLGVLGLSARERLRLVLAESACLGLLGSVLGLAAGTGLAALALRMLAGDLGGGYFPGITPRLQWSLPAALGYGALGVAAAVAGGWLPARMAQHIAPAQALKGLGGGSGSGTPAARAAVWLGPALLVLGATLALLPPVDGVPLWAYVSVACILMGGIACVPAVARALLGRWPAPRQAPWLLALERARRMPHTATIAMAGVVASLSLSVALTVMVASFRTSVTDWLDTVLPADLYARAGQAGGGAEGLRLPGSLLAQIAQLPGVTRVAGVHVSSLVLDAHRPAVALISREVGDPARSLPLVGELLPPRPGTVGIFVSEAVVDLYARPGQILPLPLRAGQPALQAYVRGVWRDYARQQGAIVIDTADHQRLSGDTDINDVAMWLAAGTRVDAVQAAVRALATRQGLDGSLLTFAEPGQIRETTLRIFDRSFAVTYWLQAVAIGIGLFGTAASFSAQVLARRKEFALLGHLGFTRAQVLGTVAGEGAAFTAVGALLGLALGIAVSVVLVKVVNPQSFHWTMDLLLPWPRLAALCLSVMLAGTLTAWLAARSAIGRDMVLAVKEDG
ncbi:MAG: ABC transporter permease [Proteobacteria bacterium]|uniref:FtsX-like permease family protein n=1 Tax=Aquabacterium sp. TaxID=1872578 RepID=UPI0035C77E62|nr:ABC transporter permease [Pseudomonadota bacterium]